MAESTTTQTEKTYTIVKTRRGQTYELTGTFWELMGFYRNTLETGHGYDKQVNLQPSGVKSLVANLNRAVRAKEKGNFYPSSYKLATA
jgi:hypothetical protein